MKSAPAVMLPFQRAWLTDKARVKVFEKSRRIGATWATAADSVLEAASGRQDIWYVSYNETSAKEFVRDAATWCRWFDVPAKQLGCVMLPENDDGDPKGIRAFQIAFPSGKRITALTSSARNLRGKSGRVIIDEAAFHDDLPSLMKASMALLMWGGEVMIMSTHNGVDNPFNELVNDCRDGKRDYSLHRVTITDALQQGLYARICRVLGQPYSQDAETKWLVALEHEYGDGVREELYCEPLRAGQSYIGRPLIESCMEATPVVRIARDEAWALLPQASRTHELTEWADAVLKPLLADLPCVPHAFGWDFGRYTDRSVLAPFSLAQDLTRRVPFLLELQCMPHNDQWTLLKYVADRLPRFFRGYMDAGGNGSWIAEQAFTQYGPEAILPVNLTVGWYALHMPLFREGHERGTIRYPRDADVLRDVLKIQRIDGVPRLPKEREAAQLSAGKRHGDAAIALCLGYAALAEAEALNARWSALSVDGPTNPWSALYAT
jgi:phage FluMu gp28-like protein